jgi:acyl dehydratase
MSFTDRLEWGPVEVTADQIAGFARGINYTGTDPHPLYVAKILIPGSAKILLAPEVGTNLQRIVHAGLRLNFHREVREGSALSSVAWLDSVEAKESGRLIAIAVEIRDGEGLVCEGITSYFERGAKRGSKGEPPPPLSGGRDVIVETSDDQSVLYAEGSGDRFPIHTDDNFARAVGLPGKIMHGMCTLALSVNAAMDDPQALKSLECRFANILLPGGEISVHVVDNGGDHQFETRRPDGKAVITGGRCSA